MKWHGFVTLEKGSPVYRFIAAAKSVYKPSLHLHILFLSISKRGYLCLKLAF